MKLKSVQLENVGRFSDVGISFAPNEDKTFNITITIGNNGAGKSTILESIATGLSWYVARIRNEKGSGTPIVELKIKNNCPSASIAMDVASIDGEKKWILSKARKGHKVKKSTKLDDLNKLTNM